MKEKSGVNTQTHTQRASPPDTPEKWAVRLDCCNNQLVPAVITSLLRHTYKRGVNMGACGDATSAPQVPGLTYPLTGGSDPRGPPSGRRVHLSCGP